jgi:hypothetical protein
MYDKNPHLLKHTTKKKLLKLSLQTFKLSNLKQKLRTWIHEQK